MERRFSLFVSRKNALTWIAAILALASAVCRIVFECTNATPCENTWAHIVLPVAAAILYVLIALIWGKEMFYKSAIPVWMICIY